MKKILLSCLLFFSLLVLLSLQTGKGRKVVPDDELSCAAPGAGNLGDIRPDADGRYVPVLPGWGHYHYKISTADDSAQFYFDQGLNLYYSYHLKESLASFKEAARNDSGCAILYWGQALAMGPYYNNTYYYKASPAVQAILLTMNRLAGRASPKERDLIGVLNRRYDTDPDDGHRAALNRSYSEGMRGLIGKYPADPDVKALYVDGVMIEHAWDMWDERGMARAWTPELINYCAGILAVNPRHPAALHYQIHLVEASLHPEAALHSADVLQALMPGVAHMVHMASHMYQRNGLYAQGVEINDRANAAQHHYDSIARQLRLGDAVVHYDAVEAFCALNAGMYVKGMRSADRARQIMAGNTASLIGRTYNQYLYSMPLFVQVRLGKWQEILDGPVPDSGLVYACLLNDFGRGLAYLRLGKMGEAWNCLARLHARIGDSVLRVRRLPQNAPIEGAKVAEGILSGELFFANEHTRDAMSFFTKAMRREDRMSYGEPKDWPLPVRHFAGACLLREGKVKDAEDLYRKDLELNPGNGWSLLGLYQCLEAQHKKEAGAYKGLYEKAFAAAEQVPTASAY